MKLFFEKKFGIVLVAAALILSTQAVFAADPDDDDEDDQAQTSTSVTPPAATATPAPVAPPVAGASSPVVPASTSATNNDNDVVIHSISNGRISGRARCSYAGEYRGLAGSIELVLVNNRVTYLDVRADNDRCRVSLDTFKQVTIRGTNNIVLKNKQGCAVTINAQVRTQRADGTISISPATSVQGASLSFGMVQTEGGPCSSICYSVAGGRGYWQIDMDPATETCN